MWVLTELAWRKILLWNNELHIALERKTSQQNAYTRIHFHWGVCSRCSCEVRYVDKRKHIYTCIPWTCICVTWQQVWATSQMHSFTHCSELLYIYTILHYSFTYCSELLYIYALLYYRFTYFSEILYIDTILYYIFTLCSNINCSFNHQRMIKVHTQVGTDDSLKLLMTSRQGFNKTSNSFLRCP